MSEPVALFALAVLVLAGGAALLGWGGGQLARRFGASPWAVGLAVVPVAAAAPTFAVGVNAALQHRDTFTLGMILNGPVVSATLALGLAALLRPLAGTSRVVSATISALLVSVLLFWFVCRDGDVSRVDAVFLLAALAAAVAYLVFVAREEPATAKAAFETGAIARRPVGVAAVAAALGLVGLVGGGYLLVPEAVEIARTQSKGSPRLFGTVAIALATSLAVLSVALAAARKRRGDLALGTAAGTGLCLVLLLPAVAAFVNPIAVPEAMQMNDFPAATLVVFLLLVPRLNGLRVSRWEGAILVAAFAGYGWWQVSR
jgi:cation:H+ antiporter